MSSVPTNATRPFPTARRHGEFKEALPNHFVVSGQIDLPGGVPIHFSRNMLVVREGERLVLVNSMRLNDEGLAALDKLGKVTDVIRIAGNHGKDDPFYADRYGAKVWAAKGQRYTPGFDQKAQAYFEPAVEFDESTKLPIEGAEIHRIASTPPEVVLRLPVNGGTIVTGDTLQNWKSADAYFNWVARLMMPLLGFIKPHNVGPAWLKNCKPPKDELRKVLDLKFENVIPGHGEIVLGNGVELFREAIERATS